VSVHHHHPSTHNGCHQNEATTTTTCPSASVAAASSSPDPALGGVSEAGATSEVVTGLRGGKGAMMISVRVSGENERPTV
jgi:hypothetical protein